MSNQLITFISDAWHAMALYRHFITWNLFLALVPLALSFWLFHRPRSAIFRWGVWFLLGITFLRNTRLVLFYLIHLVRDVGTTYVVGAVAITLGLMGFDLWWHRRNTNMPMSRSLRWWLGFFTFVAFLPNAPYVLTDVIHLIRDIRSGYSAWIVTLALIPMYLVFMAVGFQSYVLSLINLGKYLQKEGWGKYILPTEITLHILSAIGIYLGRFIRFNSWDIVTNPDELVMTVLNDLVGKRPLLVMTVTFVIITVLYWIAKLVTLAILERGHNKTKALSSAHPDSTTAEL